MIHNWCYSMNVQDISHESSPQPMTPAQIEAQLTGIVEDARARLDAGQKAPLIGALTADERGRWSEVCLSVSQPVGIFCFR
jgi:carnitine O-acetyltransferase